MTVSFSLLKNIGVATKISLINTLLVFVLVGATGIFIFRSEVRLVDSLIAEHVQEMSNSLEEQKKNLLALQENNLKTTASLIAGSSGNYIYNYDFEGLNKALAPYLDIEAIRGIEVSTTDGTEAVSLFTKDSGKKSGLMKFSRQISFNGEDMGKVTIYYTDAHVVSKLKKLKSRVENNIETIRQGTAAKLHRATNIQVGIIVLVILSLAVCTFFSLKRTVITPLRKCINVINRLAVGDISRKINIARNNELGDIGNAMDRMIETQRQRAVIAESIAAGNLSVEVKIDSDKDVLGKAFNNMITSLTAMISQTQSSSSSVAAASEELTIIADRLAEGSTEMSNQAKNVTDATGLMTREVAEVADISQSVSADMEEISESTRFVHEAFQKIGTNADNGLQVTENAMEMAKQASTSMEKLDGAAREIGEVTKTISDITNQTKLLALNATIEAARAGELGKGFAVVAGEVKELALQSSRATENIASRISGIQTSTSEAVDIIARVAEIIRDANESSREITMAVDEQSGAVNRIVETVGNADTSTAQIVEMMKQLTARVSGVDENMGVVNARVTDSTSGIQQVQDAALELSTLAARLEELIREFRLRG